MSAESNTIDTSWFAAVKRWNEERGLDKLPYAHRKNISFIIEEILEANGEQTSEDLRQRAEHVAEAMVVENPPDEELVVDSYADILVYTTGSLIRMGYDPELVAKEVLKAISSRTGKIIDGKFVKDPDAVRYEPDYSLCRL